MVVLYSCTDAGHRGDYVRFLMTLLPAERRSALALPTAREPVLFLLIEDSFVFYVLVAVIRALWGRRTVGLLFRPMPALTGTTIRLRCKRLLLRLLRFLPQCRTLTILPFSLEPRFGEIADGWIHDLQLWDLSPEEREAVSSTRERQSYGNAPFDEIEAAAGGRKVVCAIGRQDADKGFDVFTRTYADHPCLREVALFAVGGKVATVLQHRISPFETAGGWTLDKYLQADQLLVLYACADLVWCCYSKDYDQASGIFGRAVQLGIPVVVRPGSLLERLCLGEGISHFAFDPDHPDDFLAAKPADPEAGAVLAKRFAAESLGHLQAALGISPLNGGGR